MLIDDLKMCFSEADASFPVDFNQSILESGVDSIVFMRLIVAIEKRFCKDILTDDLDFNNFNTVNRIIFALSDAH